MPQLHDPSSDASIPDPLRALQFLKELVWERGDKFPRIVVAVTGYEGIDALADILRRIPAAVLSLIEEIAVFDVFGEEGARQGPEELGENPAWEKVRYCLIPRKYSYGENLKNCFDYAIAKNFEYVLILRGDGTYDPACIPQFLVSALTSQCPVVIGDRMEPSEACQPKASGTWRLAANRLLSALEESILGMRLRDYHCGFRLLSTEILGRIPYSLNAGDYLFDLQLLIQIRCLGVPVCTVPVPAFHDMTMKPGTLVHYAYRSLGIALAYRMHQLHLVRRAAYFVDLGEHYTLKRNRYSSHMQILDSVQRGSTVLDIGCGRSLLAEEYARRDITVVGVDSLPPERVSPFVDAYIQHDLELPLELPYGRVFDYVILSDVIEHIINRDALMETLRKHLKPHGRLVASTGNIAIWFYRLSLLLGRFEYGPRGILDRTHVHLFTLDSFGRFFRQRGYRLLDVKFTPIPFELVFSSTGRSTVVEALTHWYHQLARIWPRMFAYQIIVSCTFRSYESAAGEELWQPTDYVEKR
jgi:SAM-dependent methyltransferase